MSPLTFQLKSAWDEATDKAKEICTDKAMEGCSVICEIIAPNAGEELLRSCAQLSDQETERASGDLLALMQAYKNAPTANLKTKSSVFMLTVTQWKNCKRCTSLTKA